ncbi:MAG: hypothetical protein COY66_02575 [Candidatus Kerfeldbacteria bacterium CG_4_10_14_0_8_um_filter_42_10]|uniref:Uncharacterized protein n=1 Tax=Candidatus Kerfeldbacteria bacterium CG_4_10_14_0_8_um_filter_42_10 TaxID=2014248 RepID=A0A2M7RKB5_9BACT|nr:MAG: hypothetical protein COY66_02575 [Candidatus Kerfeldbacteria bacterium CG_4_10_14_0_8_um_filter_42_10]
MNKRIITIAERKFRQLKRKCPNFINVILDDWRGFRLIYDTEDVRKCDNNCDKCRLFLTLNEEPNGLFTAGLIPASAQDKKLFGQQNFLNCKTVSQYKQCYLNFIGHLKSINEINKELKLVKGLKFIYCLNKNKNIAEQKFKREILLIGALMKPAKN